MAFKPLHSIAGALLLFGAVPSQASISDPLIRGAKECTDQFALQESRHGIPQNYLAAIANTESGRWSDTLSMVVPWPWTINAEGKGFYFNSKAEAIRKVRELQAQGMKSIDVGCMQINLKHHPNAFASLEQAFDPRYNVAYAATFLRNNFNDLQNWSKALAAYHSRTPKYGNKYLARLQKSHDAITGKVSSARTALASLPVDPDSRQARRESPSYRVVRVYDRREREFASLQAEPSQAMALGTKSKAFSLKVNETGAASPAAEGEGKALRAVDRLSTPSLRRISVSETGGSVKTIRLGDGGSAKRQSASSASRSEGLVSHFNDSTKQSKPAAGVKPKFVFID